MTTFNTPQFPDRAAAVTPSDATILPPSTIYVGVAGNVAVEPVVGGVAVTFTAVPAGSYIGVRVKRVLATGTTATNMVAIS